MKISPFWGDSHAISEKCAKCGAYDLCKKPFTGVFGKGSLKTLVIAGKPSNIEDKGGSPISGRTMSKFKGYCLDVGINVTDSFWKCNALQCYIKDQKKVDKAIPLCRENLAREIKKLKPRHIITLGYIATTSTIGQMFEMPPVASLCKHHIPIHEYNTWVHPILDPGMLKNENEEHYFRRSMKNILDFIKKDPEMVEVDPFEKVEVLTEVDDVLEALKWTNDNETTIAWDIEGTSLKPHYEEQRITSIGIASEKYVYSFPLWHNEAYNSDDEIIEVENELIKVLTNPKIWKIAHNRKFDEGWAEFMFNIEVASGLHCTQVRQHLLDHRVGTKSLKDQAFLRWGIREYDKRSKPYIKAEIRGAEQLNRMHEMPLREQLLYVGADAYLTFKLSTEQSKEYAEIPFEDKSYGFSLFEESNDTLKRMQNRGFPCKKGYYAETDKRLRKEMDEAIEGINSDPGVIEFNKRYDKTFSWTSPVDLKTVLFDIKGHDPESVKKTEGGQPSTDEQALDDLGDPIGKAILKFRKLYKLSNTYMSQFIREETGDRIYPTFSLNTVVSLRSSSSDPNLHNIPKHDDYANEVCRTGFIPDYGMGMGEMDFEGMEVGTSASYHEDENFIKYLITPGADMHRDNTCDLWLITPEQVYKALRYHTKNKWTFPQFYGDYFGSCGPELWKEVIRKNKMELPDGTPIVEHLIDQGIKSEQAFIKHCRDVEDKMWNTRFKQYTKWKQEINEFYNKHGYIRTHMGFTLSGLMDKKQTTNYPIQGTAFHLLLWCMNRLDKWLTDNKMRTYINGQIHDSIVFMWAPDELQDVLRKMRQVCTIDIAHEFPWINVPMGIEVEVSKLREEGGHFSAMEQIALPEV